ncbi:hypothetical protein HSBAA_17500 [Vreelandella sulfidaeris]|uniref:Uncharacterized protein n=1 Tax=Vreelandella sulfidaeris TaxID=115553 RepID=A0A455UB39_9GAMM|nr:hypothetical protein HSBAA_17500 [Halomonas sulfidaeris]
MGARQHRLGGVGNRQLGNFVSHFVHGGQHGVKAVAEHHAVGEVVDIFAGAGKVNELGDRMQLRLIGNLFF